MRAVAARGPRHALLLAAVLAACGGPPPEVADPPPPAPTRGVLLISFDTLRADHLGAYGYQRDTSPFFDRLADQGTLFEQAIVQFPSTLTSHMSMLTGLYPAQHGVYPPAGTLDERVETLAERLQRTGFRTAAHTEGGYVRGSFGFRQGFEEFVARDRRGPEEITRTFRRGVRFLERLAPEERFFLFLHTYCVHTPYEPPEDYRGRFWSGEAPPGAFDPTGPDLARHNRSGALLSPEVLAYFTALYDETIRYADDQLRWLFGELERLDLRDEVTVIVTSDHGEELQEHGRMNHEQLYPEVMRVPLLVLHPQRTSAARRRSPVQSIDLAPTILELAGLEAPPELPGRSLARVLGSTGGEAAAEAYAEGPGGRALWRQESDPAAAGGELWQVLVEQPPDDAWHARRARISPRGGRLAFAVRGAGEPRDLSIRQGGQELAVVTIGPDWRQVELAAAAGEPVELEVPSCDWQEDGSCLGFQLRGVALARAELYETLSDPLAATDRAPAERRRVGDLLRRLGAYRWEGGEGRQETLDAETEAELRALGYLQ